MTNSDNYNQSKFEDDLKQLQDLMNNNKKGGKKKTKKSMKKRVMKKRVMKKRVMKKRVMKKRSSKKSMKGGFTKNDERHFKVIEVNGKPVDFGIANIRGDRTPLSAARKLLKSIAKHFKVYGNNRFNFRVTFKIYETTQGSKHKQYGPYQGRYHRYSPEEMKKAKAAGQTFRMKPVVKLIKGKSTNETQKGGKKDKENKKNKKNNNRKNNKNEQNGGKKVKKNNRKNRNEQEGGKKKRVSKKSTKRSTKKRVTKKTKKSRKVHRGGKWGMSQVFDM